MASATEPASLDPRVLTALITLAATILAFGLNALLTHVILPRIQSRKEKQGTVDRYGFPLARAVRSNVVYLRTFIRNASNGWFSSRDDDYFKLALLYTLAEFFGYWQQIEEYAYLEFAKRGTSGDSLNRKGLRVFRTMNSFMYFPDRTPQQLRDMQKFTIPRRVSQAIGERMIVRKAGEAGSVVGFSTFCEMYDTDMALKRWLKYPERLFAAAEAPGNKDALERLSLMLCSFEVFEKDLNDLLKITDRPSSEVVLKTIDAGDRVVLENFLFAYRLEEYVVKAGALDSKSVDPKREEQLVLPLPSGA